MHPISEPPRPVGLPGVSPSTRARSKRSEAKTAAILQGGRVRAGSGARTGAKGDVRSTRFLAEDKTTGKESISIKKEWLKKISREALGEGRIPLLAVSFEQMPPGVDARWIMVPASFWAELGL